MERYTSPNAFRHRDRSFSPEERIENFCFVLFSLNRFLFEVPNNISFGITRIGSWEKKKAPFPWMKEEEGRLLLEGTTFDYYFPWPDNEKELREFARKYKRRINP